MKFIFIIFFLFCCSVSEAQGNKYSDPQNMDVIYTSDAVCDFGELLMYKNIYDGIVYTEDAKKSNLNDTTIISFDVNFDDSLSSFIFINKVGYGIDEQIVEIIKAIKFRAAIANGIKVRQNIILKIPITTFSEM